MYPNLPEYPAKGALEDTREYIENFIDPNYTLHITMSKVIADVILRLSDTAILPFDLQSLITLVKTGRKMVLDNADVFTAAGVEYGMHNIRYKIIHISMAK